MTWTNNSNFSNLPQMNLNKQAPVLNEQNFKQLISGINDNILNQLVQVAQAQGISAKDIEAGMAYINKIR